METIEHHSRNLTVIEFQSAMDSLPELIKQSVGNEFFIAMYGFGCDIHGDLTYVPMRLLPSHLPSFFRDSVAQRIFHPGKTDLLFEFPNQRLTITFCHEGDIHFGGKDSKLIECFLSASPFCEFGFPERHAVRPVKGPIKFDR